MFGDSQSGIAYFLAEASYSSADVVVHAVDGWDS
jgi:hypothetical protein